MAKENGSKLLVLNVAHVPGVTVSSAAEITKMEQKQTNAVLDQAKERLAAEGVQAKFKLTMGQATQSILYVCKEEECELIVIGTRGMGNISEMILGSVSSKVIEQAEVPVMVCRIPEK